MGYLDIDWASPPNDT